MKVSFALLFCFLIVLLSSPVHAQSAEFCTQLDLIQRATIATHVSPKPLDNDMSSAVYDLFLAYLDEDKINFTQDQVDTFSHLKSNIDNALRNRDCGMLRTVTIAYKDYLEARKAFLKENLDKPQDYTGADQLVAKRYKNPLKTIDESDEDETGYFESDVYRSQTWSKFLRLEILSRISRSYPTLELATASFIEEEKRVRTRMILDELCTLEDLINNGTVDKAIEEIFLHIYMTYHDPHSAFFNADEKESYEHDLATGQESYGFSIAKNSDDEYYVDYIAHGSPASINNDMQVNDVILALEVNNINKDLTCTSAGELNYFLGSIEHKKIVLTLRNKAGNTVKVNLVKSKTAIEQNAVRGYLVGENTKTGYIHIPSFYTDLDESFGLGIANDVAKEIYRLQQEQIKGLTIDLRGNGGGSLKEAIDLVGLFIDRGPISILEIRNTESEIANDFNNGAAYKGPLTVLVDYQSASASELFAAVIQEYGRGIIVGQPTYGKATIQNVIPLNQNNESLGFIKVTKGAFYNVNGSTHQGKGVQPQVIMPMLGNAQAVREENEPYYIKLDTLETTLTYQKNEFYLDDIINGSIKRVATNAFLQQIGKQDAELQSLLTNYPDILDLDLKSVFKMIKTRENGLEPVTNTANESLINVSNILITSKLITKDSMLSNSNKTILERISKDPYIYECHNILMDFKAENLWD